MCMNNKLMCGVQFVRVTERVHEVIVPVLPTVSVVVFTLSSVCHLSVL